MRWANACTTACVGRRRLFDAVQFAPVDPRGAPGSRLTGSTTCRRGLGCFATIQKRCGDNQQDGIGNPLMARATADGGIERL
jgi:hypothetical protein